MIIIKDKHLDSIINQLQKHINNKDLKTLTKITYQYNTYILKSKVGIDKQQKIVNFLKSYNDNDKTILPIDFCNMLLENNIIFNIKFHYLNKCGILSNIRMFKHTLFIKKQCFKIFNKYKITKINKTFTDKNKNKQFRQLGILLENEVNYRLFRLTIDLNVLFKPKHVKEIRDNIIINDYSWLMFQLLTRKVEL